jgi:hypothetical protein
MPSSSVIVPFQADCGRLQAKGSSASKRHGMKPKQTDFNLISASPIAKDVQLTINAPGYPCFLA